jgi:hypothetical protein
MEETLRLSLGLLPSYQGPSRREEEAKRGASKERRERREEGAKRGGSEERRKRR